MNESLRITTQIDIEAPIDGVWETLTDLDGYEHWNPYLVKIEGQCSADEIITVHSVSEPGAERMVLPVLIRSVEPYKMRWEGGLPDREQFCGDHWFELSDEKEGVTRLNQYEAFTGTLAKNIITAHGAAIEANFGRFNAALKIYCERD